MLSPKRLAASTLVFAAVSVLAVNASAQVTPGNLTTLYVPIEGGWSIAPTSINDRGVVTANVSCVCPPSAMLWDAANGWRNIGGLGGLIQTTAINNHGQVVGSYITADYSRSNAVLWDEAGGWREIAPGSGVFPRDINDHGLIVGSIGGGGGFSFTDTAGVTLINDFNPIAVNNAGQMINSTGFVRDAGGAVRALTSGLSTESSGINDAGQVVGSVHLDGKWQAAVWSADGTMTAIPALGAFDYEDFEFGTVHADIAKGLAINDRGQIVGLSSTQGGSFVPFVWDPVSGMQEVVISGFWGYIQPVGLNNNGEVIAISLGQRDRAVYFTVPLPAPATPQAAAEAIADDIEALVDSGAMSGSNAASITTKLDAAIAALDRGNVGAAANQLTAAINRVNALVNSGKLTAAQGQELRVALQGVIDSL
jgi:hypothetical protein